MEEEDNSGRASWARAAGGGGGGGDLGTENSPFQVSNSAPLFFRGEGFDIESCSP